MRLREFSGEQKNSIEATVAGILNFLRNRAHNYKIPLEINTDELVSMVQRTGVPFSYDALVKINEKPTIQNLIASIGRDKIKVRPFGDESGKDDSEKIVNKTDQEKKAEKQAAQMNVQEPIPGAPGQMQQPQDQEIVQPIDNMGQGKRINQVDNMAKRAMNRRR